jgi:hypothetical protein
MKKPYLLSFLLMFLLVLGCSYSVRMNIYPHLRNVAIMPFEDRTLEIHLAEELRDSLISSFQRDGRLRISYEDPDSRIEGQIVEYENNIFGYDLDQNIEEYQVRLTVSLTFTDLVRNEVIWENKALMLSERYTPLSTEEVRFKTEEEALQELYKKLFETIIRNTLESW